MNDRVVVSDAGGVLEIRLNRPEKKNALTRDMYETVSAALGSKPNYLLPRSRRVRFKASQ